MQSKPTPPSRLRLLRIEKGFTLSAMAHVIGLQALSVISEAERGLFVPSKALAERWGSVLGVRGENIRRLAREAGRRE